MYLFERLRFMAGGDEVGDILPDDSHQGLLPVPDRPHPGLYALRRVLADQPTQKSSANPHKNNQEPRIKNQLPFVGEFPAQQPTEHLSFPFLCLPLLSSGTLC